MSFSSQSTSILIAISLLIISLVCEYQVESADSYWTQSQNQNVHFSQWNTTPWPALSPRQKSEIPKNPTWVRLTQRTNTITNSRRQYYSFPSNNRNFTTGYNGISNNRRENLNQTTSSVTDDELRQLSETLLTKDINNAAKYVTVNLQSKTTSRSQKDEAPLPLLSVREDAFNIPSIEKMLHLHNNYIVQSNVAEDYTDQEKNEENIFLNTIINTPVMQHIRDFLMEKGKIGSDREEFKRVLNEIWFNMYSRGQRKVGSSGFEHVFLAEIKNNQISGLHNWLYFNEEEKNSRANYLGYMKNLDLGNKGAVLKYHFLFHGIDKPVGSMFIGTSPEFEMALYTTCFLFRADEICPMKLNGHRFVIRTFTYRFKGKKLIGSAFPEI